MVTVGHALEFNGKNSYVNLPTLHYDGSHPITLEATICSIRRNREEWLLATGEKVESDWHFPAGPNRPRGLFIVTDTIGERFRQPESRWPFKSGFTSLAYFKTQQLACS